MSTNPECSIRETRMQGAPGMRSRSLVQVFHAARDAFTVAQRRFEQRARLRRELERLEARDLRDIGVSREQLEREAMKPFWRP